jgi:hypothetical protein
MRGCCRWEVRFVFKRTNSTRQNERFRMIYDVFKMASIASVWTWCGQVGVDDVMSLRGPRFQDLGMRRENRPLGGACLFRHVDCRTVDRTRTGTQNCGITTCRDCSWLLSSIASSFGGVQAPREPSLAPRLSQEEISPCFPFGGKAQRKGSLTIKDAAFSGSNKFKGSAARLAILIVVQMSRLEGINPQETNPVEIYLRVLHFAL